MVRIGAMIVACGTISTTETLEPAPNFNPAAAAAKRSPFLPTPASFHTPVAPTSGA